MKSKSIIELNGSRYDAASGTRLDHTTAVSPKRQPSTNIDGFFRTRSVGVKTSTPPTSDSITVLSAPVLAPKPAKPAGRATNHAKAHVPQPAKTEAIRVHSEAQHSQKLTVHRSPASPNHTLPHTTQTSQTLMRSAVQRPAPSLRSQARPAGALQHSVPSLIVPKKSAISLDEQRLVKAQATARSPYVSHHADARPQLTPTIAALPVVPQPVKPQEQVPAAPPPPMPTNKPTDIFEHALANATHYVDIHAHRQAYRKKVRTHVASMLAGSLVLIAIASFVAYQNSPALQLKVASVRAGISVRMPNLSSLGFTWGGVKANDGKVTVGLTKGANSYQLTQQSTNLSSDDMIANLGATDASGTPDYTAVPAGSTTVYRFGNTTATWVQDGTWYTLTGTAPLNNTQLASLVKSI